MRRRMLTTGAARMHPSKERRGVRGSTGQRWWHHDQHGHEAVQTNNQPRGENNGKPEVKDDGTRDEEEAPGGGEWERDRGCPRGLSRLRYTGVGILPPGSCHM